MSRRDDLLKIIPDDSKDLMTPTVDEILYLEERLAELKQLPFIEVNPKNKLQQRSTPAAKLYKELLQQYINCIKSVEYGIYKDKKSQADEVEDSPLRKWFKENG